jgi:RNA polymerase sigma factor (sigma-70 family)
VRHLRHIVAPNFEQYSDGELLHAFATRHDEVSFAALVQRHGELVLNVCRYVLGHEQDAEDAFQATFLVLAKKAGSVRDAASLAGFLHGVAYRLSWKAKRDAARRRKHETQAARTPRRQGTEELVWRDVQMLVEKEIALLPEKYRTPFVRCYLQGLNRAEAARELDVPEGTIWSRLSWARRRLQERLARRGVILSAVLAAFALSDRTCPATLSRLRKVVSANARAFADGQTLNEVASTRALALAEAGLSSFTAFKLKWVVTSLLLMVLAGIGGAILTVRTATPEATVPYDKPAEAPKNNHAEQVRTDRHGDPLPAGAITRLGTVRWRHGFFVFLLAFSPDGKKLAAIGAGRDITLWDVATGKEIVQFPNKVDQPVGLAFSPDGKTLVTSARKGILTLWDVGTGKQLSQLQGSRGGSRVAFAPDGKMLAAANYDDTVRMWDLATGKEQRRLNCGQKGLYGLAFSPDGNLLATAGVDGTIRLWDPHTGEERRRLTGHAKGVARVVFSPDGKLLASAG